ncbi:MAG: hypothetical protein IPF71_13550 [Rhodoferax sp.]|nr:hypothetical protein [Rhodoferax sp.]
MVSDGSAISILLRSWPSAVTVDVVGWALNIASLILMAGSTAARMNRARSPAHAPWTPNRRKFWRDYVKARSCWTRSAKPWTRLPRDRPKEAVHSVLASPLPTSVYGCADAKAPGLIHGHHRRRRASRYALPRIRHRVPQLFQKDP